MVVMRITTILRASPVLLLLSVALSAGCGSSVVTGTGGNGGGSSSSSSTSTSTSTSSGGGAGGFAACDGPGQCVIANKGCCDPCGAPELADVTAINGKFADAFFQSTCPEPTPCPACATAVNPNLFAYCDNGTCKAADASKHPVSECKADADCSLRYGTGCCQSCGAVDASWLIAVSDGGLLLSLVCGEDVGCPACVPTYPSDASAICSAGHCAVVFSADGGG